MLDIFFSILLKTMCIMFYLYMIEAAIVKYQ